MKFRSLDKLDMKDKAEEMINIFGVDILFLRSSNYIKCNCYNEINKQSNNENCPVCFGRGYVSTIEKDSIMSQGLNSINSSQELVNRDLSMLLLDREICYFKSSSKPKDNDVLMYCDFDDNGNVLKVKKISAITNIESVKGEDGKCLYYTAITRQVPELIREYNKFITQLPNEVFKMLKNGRKYVCGTING